MRFDSIVWNRTPGEIVSLEFERNGKILNKAIAVYPRKSLVPRHMPGTEAPCLIVGDYVFTILSFPYLKKFGRSWPRLAPSSLMDCLKSERSNGLAIDQFVVLSHDFSSRRNIHRIVRCCDDERIRSFSHFYDCLSRSWRMGKDVRIQLVDGDHPLCISMQTARQRSARLVGEDPGMKKYTLWS